MTTAIQVENLSKAYQLGNIGTGTISRDIHRWLTTKILGKEDPFLKIGETNDRSTKGTSDIVWSLKDINFSIEQGDAVGIIGKNGAGKSTLLKLLSRVTAPTTGNIKVKGRVASLLEVGTGFHPELTGRENIYLNGAILGMRKKEITRKMDEIVAFSGVERYIDTPVKRYSSGMYVRLAFAVAAHLESEILIVDEVLAVGDAEFQKKCLGKMGEVSKGEGRTVLFVSHNMASISNLCQSGILLVNGELNAYDKMPDVVTKYQIINQTSAGELINFNRDGSGSCRVTNISLSSQDHSGINTFKLGDMMKIELTITNFTNYPINDLRIIIGVYNLNEEGYLRFDSEATNTPITLSNESTVITCKLNEHINIKPDQYKLNILLLQGGNTIDYLVGVQNFSIVNFDYFQTGKSISNPELSKVFYQHEWLTNS